MGSHCQWDKGPQLLCGLTLCKRTSVQVAMPPHRSSPVRSEWTESCAALPLLGSKVEDPFQMSLVSRWTRIACGSQVRRRKQSARNSWEGGGTRAPEAVPVPPPGGHIWTTQERPHCIMTPDRRQQGSPRLPCLSSTPSTGAGVLPAYHWEGHAVAR